MKKLVGSVLATGIILSGVSGVSAATKNGVQQVSQQVKTGWIQGNGTWKYYENGKMKIGWIQDNGKWYYLNNEGFMQTGLRNVNGTYYFFDLKNGAMKTGWVDGGFTNTGIKLWYYFNADGKMKTDWVQDNGKWYYLDKDGFMQTGLKNINGTYYYLDRQTGDMKTGWVYDAIDSKTGVARWLYFDKNGAMKTGWIEQNGKWYYLNKEGLMQTRFVTVEGKIYYCDLQTGEMKTGRVYDEIDRKWYEFDHSGVLIAKR
ncbi:N-acetylmuramoyl-L-alanine amidase family protein [Bacillus thuringiensis]|nr:N-acetylmuramoyl-L-alanine amidase family protein [Bacillus thuringiensis]